MKRDLDICRRIALAAEAMSNGTYLSELSGIDAPTFAGHVQLLLDAGFVDARVFGYLDDSANAAVLRLTNDGHDFLDATRSNTRWEKAKKAVIESGSSLTLFAIKEWLKTQIA